jgi:triosephosphate isomerase
MAITYVFGNWKMNFTLPEAVSNATNLDARLEDGSPVEVAIGPSNLYIHPISQNLTSGKLKLVAQTLSAPDFGAFTGETSAAQLANFVKYAFLGHSERRIYFGETDDDIAEKIQFAINHQITPVICVGETAMDRTAGKTEEVLREQLRSALASVDNSQVLIAYEPVWAISSFAGAYTATPELIAATVQKIREIIPTVSTPDIPPILYGGSVDPTNAESYLTIDGINGVLVGSASLDIDKFGAIIEVAKKVAI